MRRLWTAEWREKPDESGRPQAFSDMDEVELVAHFAKHVVLKKSEGWRELLGAAVVCDEDLARIVVGLKETRHDQAAWGRLDELLGHEVLPTTEGSLTEAEARDPTFAAHMQRLKKKLEPIGGVGKERSRPLLVACLNERRARSEAQTCERFRRTVSPRSSLHRYRALVREAFVTAGAHPRHLSYVREAGVRRTEILADDAIHGIASPDWDDARVLKILSGFRHHIAGPSAVKKADAVDEGFVHRLLKSARGRSDGTSFTLSTAETWGEPEGTS